MSNDSLKDFYGDQALSPHEAEQKTPLNKPLTESNEIQTSQSVNRRNVNRDFQKSMSERTDQLKRTFKWQKRLIDKLHKMLKESRKIVKENKDQQQQMWEKLQKVEEELQQFKEQHKHLIEPDPMSTVVKVS
jgi:uncharacterized coiled-coil protein SlyX